MGFWPKLALSLLGVIVVAGLSSAATWRFCSDHYAARIAALDARRATIALMDTQARTTATMAVALKALAAKERVQTVTKTIVERIPKYVTAKADAGCTVPDGFRLLHDAAASGNPVSDSAARDHDSPSGIALSAVAGTVVTNYGVCRENAEQLKAAQDWIRSQQALNQH